MWRKLSWLFAVIAYLGAPLWAWLAIAADREAQTAAYGLVKCGNPIIGTMLLASLISGAASLLAAGLGLASYLQVSGPRPKLRVVEIAALLLPLPVAIFIAGSILWA